MSALLHLLAAFLVIAGCSGDGPPEPSPSSPRPPPGDPWDLRPRGVEVVRLLDLLPDAALELPPDVLPEAGPSRGWIPLEGRWRREGGGRWSVASPIHFEQSRFRAAPWGISLEADGRLLEFDAVAGRRRSWAVDRDRIVVRLPEPPRAARLHVPALEASEARLNLALAGLPAAEFARVSAAVGDERREGLLLPAPARAVFRLAPPPGARLRFGLAVVRPEGAPPTGARARLEVRVDGKRAWSGTAAEGEEWRDVEIELPGRAAAAGPVEVEFRTDPLGDPLGDYVVVSAPKVVGEADAADPARIVVVGMDTLRPDHLGFYGYGRDTSPELDRIGRASVAFPRAWAPAPRTRPSFRTVLTGRWPLDAITAPTVAEALRRAGFATAGFAANVQLHARLGFARGFDTWVWHPTGDAEDQVDLALEWLEARPGRDAFVFLHFMDPHVFYLAPRPWRDRFVEEHPDGIPDRYNRWTVEGWARSGRLTDEVKEFVVARYDGEVAYLSHELGRLVAALDRLPGRTLLVLLSDHGEEFWEHGGYEHNHSLHEEVVRVVLWFRPPAGLAPGRRVGAPAGLVDVVPTLLELAGVEPPGPLDGRSLAPLLRGDEGAEALARALEERPLQLGHLMFDRERWGVVVRGHKYVLRTANGAEELYDLAADPGEHRNLAGRADLAPWRAALEAATGFPVGPGLRLHLARVAAPFVLRFDEPVRGAGVIDPEADREMRANIEWGEVPPVLPRDVAEVVLSDDRHEVRVRPGSARRGTVFVLGPDSLDGIELAPEGGEPRPLRSIQRLGGGRLRAEPGAVIAVRTGEVAHLREAREPAVEAALRALGYLDAEEDVDAP